MKLTDCVKSVFALFPPSIGKGMWGDVVESAAKQKRAAKKRKNKK